MNLSNKTELELYFADNFNTILFPVLADAYLKGGDAPRARKVCDIGLKQHPTQPDGLFILAEVDRADGNIETSEKGFKAVLKECPDHLNAAIALAKIQTELGRAGGTLTRAWKTVKKLDPTHEEALQYFEEKNPSDLPATPDPVIPEPIIVALPAQPKPTASAPFSISPRLATFTMVTILRNQGLNDQALDVLNMLEAKGEDLERITKERIAIQGETNE
ncbi:MAG: hypothetical protein HOD97_03650 [Candidatus Marinimicrobia bacterium]|jgi:tetratricopeptide (TPR) repeat protein|nr:hypothetical protein [Candidatus Neomarinimicrobiota bacterium]MBT4569357.1 hypothetical protein [Candidatus Neomarinimicrobiota bacterium]MBT5339315.1 hypothetical protein [Candidatus Neomarinimicrobiota bacterium]MBT6000504.1 hypothetical protein [Candidatus Neomarinimicrobiota bacterium]MBT7112087.1 hypothetical protein [Candidatus Neomarinimicrobiota bacterium]